MGVTEITDIFITHAHTDHFNRFADTVLRYRIHARNVVIPDYHAAWAEGPVAQWERSRRQPRTRPRLRQDPAWELDPLARSPPGSSASSSPTAIS